MDTQTKAYIAVCESGTLLKCKTLGDIYRTLSSLTYRPREFNLYEITEDGTVGGRGQYDTEIATGEAKFVTKYIEY